MSTLRLCMTVRLQCCKATSVLLPCTRQTRHLHLSNLCFSEESMQTKPVKRNIRSKLHKRSREDIKGARNPFTSYTDVSDGINHFSPNDLSPGLTFENQRVAECDKFGNLRAKKSAIKTGQRHVAQSVNRNRRGRYSKEANTFGTLLDDVYNRANESLASEVGSHNEKFPDDQEDIADRPHIRLDSVNRRHKSYWYDRKIKELGKEGKVNEAISVLEDWMLVKDRAMPTAYTFTSLIGVLGKVGYTKKAFQVFNNMKKMGLAPGDATYTSLFNACSNSPWSTDGLARADKLRDLMKVKGFEANLITYHAMIKTYGVLGQLQTSFALMDELVGKYHPIPTTFSFLMMACISDKQAGFKHAIEVWRMMKKFQVVPDLPLYNLLIRAARDCGVGDTDFANTLLSDGRQETLSISAADDTTTHYAPTKRILNDTSDDALVPHDESKTVLLVQDETTAVTPRLNLPNLLEEHNTDSQMISFGDLNKPENRLAVIGGANGLLEMMARGGVRPDIRTFSQLFRTCTPTYEAESQLIKVMKELRVKPDVTLFNELIHRRCSRRELDTAKRVLKMIYAYGLVPDMKTFGCLAMTCTDRRSGMQILDDIDKAGLSPNIEILGTLSAVSRFDFVYKLLILERVELLDLKPNYKFIEGIEKKIADVKTRIVSEERGESDSSYMTSKYFQHTFQEFMVSYKAWLKKTETQRDPHPWEQFKAKIE